MIIDVGDGRGLSWQEGEEVGMGQGLTLERLCQSANFCECPYFELDRIFSGQKEERKRDGDKKGVIERWENKVPCSCGEESISSWGYCKNEWL